MRKQIIQLPKISGLVFVVFRTNIKHKIKQISENITYIYFFSSVNLSELLEDDDDDDPIHCFEFVMITLTLISITSVTSVTCCYSVLLN